MIVKLKGKIDNYSENFIDIDVKDIVFRVLMTNSNVEFFKETTTDVEVFIYEIIKEDSRTFIGFKNFQEREVFSDLLSDQGVGSKMAINIISPSKLLLLKAFKQLDGFSDLNILI